MSSFYLVLHAPKIDNTTIGILIPSKKTGKKTASNKSAFFYI